MFLQHHNHWDCLQALIVTERSFQFQRIVQYIVHNHLITAQLFKVGFNRSHMILNPAVVKNSVVRRLLTVGVVDHKTVA